VFDWARSGTFEEAVREMSTPYVFLESHDAVRIARETELNWDDSVESVRKFLTSRQPVPARRETSHDSTKEVLIPATRREALQSIARQSALAVAARGYRAYVSLLSWRRTKSH